MDRIGASPDGLTDFFLAIHCVGAMWTGQNPTLKHK